MQDWIETPRLQMVPFGPEHLISLTALYGDPGSMRWIGDGSVLSEAECRHWMSLNTCQHQRHGYGLFAIRRHDHGGVVGFCGLAHSMGQGEAEFQYAVQPESPGAGVMPRRRAGAC